MAGSDNLNLALKITADAKQAQAALQETQAQIKGVEQAAGGATNSAQRYTQQMSALTKTNQQTAQQAKNTADALALMSQIDPTAGKLAKLDALEASLKRLKSAMDPEDFARMGEILAGQRATLTGVGKDLETVGKSALNARTQYSAFALISDAATGQFSRSKRELGALANETGILGSLLNPVGLAIGAVTLALAGLAAAFVSAERENSKFNDTITQTGGYVGTTAEGLREMSASLQASGASARSADQAVLAVAATGRFTGDQIRQVAQAVENMARATGMSLKDATKQALHLAEDPISGLETLQSTMHMVSIEALDQARAYVDVGDKADAAQIAINEYGRIAQTVLQQHEQDLGTVRTFWQDLKTAISNAASEVVDFGDKAQHAAQLAAARAVLEQNIASGNVQRDESGALSLTAQGQALAAIGQSEGANVFGGSLSQRLAGAAEAYKQLNGAAEDAAQASAKTAAKQQQIAEAGDAASQSIQKLAKGYDKAADRAAAVAKVTETLNKLMLANRDLPKGVLATPAGVDQFTYSGKGFDYLVNKELGASARGPKGPNLDKLQANANLAAIQDSLTAIQNAYQNADKQLAALRKSDLLNDTAYYNALRTNLDDYVADRTAALEKEKAQVLADAKTAAERITAKKKADQIDQQISDLQQERATKRMQIDADEKASIEKTAQAWLDLQASLGRPVDVDTAKAMKKLKDLYDLLEKLKDEGKAPSADEVDSMVGAALATGVQKSPRLRSLRNIPGENKRDNPLALVDQDRQNENVAYAQQQAQLAANYAAAQKAYQDNNDKLLQLQQQYQKESEMYANQHKDAMAQITQAEYWGRLQVASDLLGQLAQLSNSQNKKVAAVGKAAAITQAMINTYASAVAAYKAGVSVGGPAAPAIGAAYAAVAIAAGLANVAQIRAQSTGGYSRGGYTGDAPVTQAVGVVHGREGVLSASEVQAIGGEAGFNALRRAIGVGYADGGYVSPFANVPSPQEVGFNVRSMPRVSMQAMAARHAAQRPQDIKVVAVWDREQAAHEVMNSHTGQKVIVVTVGNNPRAIQGKWSAG